MRTSVELERGVMGRKRREKRLTSFVPAFLTVIYSNIPQKVIAGDRGQGRGVSTKRLTYR